MLKGLHCQSTPRSTHIAGMKMLFIPTLVANLNSDSESVKGMSTFLASRMDPRFNPAEGYAKNWIR